METLTENRMPERVSSHRRANKPLVEKRRRARINDSLSQLKSLLLQAMKQDSAQFSRLEKADILEMTVKYLRHMQRQHVSTEVTSDPSVAAKYRAGFNQCANEVLNYFQSSNGVKEEVKSSLADHLGKCLSIVTPAPPSITEHQQTTFHDSKQTTYAARAESVSPVNGQTRCLQPLQIQIPESADMMTSSPNKQTTPTSLLLMPLAHSTPVAPVMHVQDHVMSTSRDSSPDSFSVPTNFNDYKNITNIRVHPYHSDIEYVQQTTRVVSPSYPVHPVPRMSTGTRMYESVSPVHRYSPPQCAFQEEKVWRPW
ncbi:transcription factor HES-4-B-like [Haliotis cracherodii]|uniref:transcription factor HES-4-B-like n=1 Tax=Haliotis cracherodii TaxID=6455 RepID=UPI0039E8D92D